MTDIVVSVVNLRVVRQDDDDCAPSDDPRLMTDLSIE